MYSFTETTQSVRTLFLLRATRTFQAKSKRINLSNYYARVLGSSELNTHSATHFERLKTKLLLTTFCYVILKKT